MVRLIAATGLRIGELLALRWCTLDLEGGSLAVRESVFEGKFQPPKTLKAVRTIPLGRHAVGALGSHRERVLLTAPEDLVFGNGSGKPLRESILLRNVLQPAAERAGLGRVTWHQFRHIHWSVLNDLNVPVKIAQEQLGQATPLGFTQPDHFVFPWHGRSKRIDPTRGMTSWRSAWRSIRKAAGLTDVRFHDGRHTAITTLAEKGLPDWVIQAQVGHVAPQMMKTYSHIRRAGVESSGSGAGAVWVGTDHADVADTTASNYREHVDASSYIITYDTTPRFHAQIVDSSYLVDSCDPNI